MYIVDSIGATFISLVTEIGSWSFFFMKTIKTLFTRGLRIQPLLLQMKRIGVDSSTIIILSTLSSGFALALQSYAGLSRIGGQEMLGVIVAWGMTRELGPVLTAIMVCGRSGSSIAAELGTMQITEQVNALRTLCINPFHYLIVPRIVAGTLIMPFLTLFGMFFGILGGYLFALSNLTTSPEVYLVNIKKLLQFGDIIGGLIKSCVFGFILTFVGCYKGFKTTGGAREVGFATTSAVVIGCIAILISNYILSVYLLKAGL